VVKCFREQNVTRDIRVYIVITCGYERGVDSPCSNDNDNYAHRVILMQLLWTYVLDIHTSHIIKRKNDFRMGIIHNSKM
jgi:hypothetical protein